MITNNYKSGLNFCHIFTLIWCAYVLFAQSGGLFTRITMLFIIGVLLFYVFYSNIHYKDNSVLKALNYLVILFAIYGLLSIIWGRRISHINFSYSISSYLYIRRIILSLLPIYVYYSFAKQGKLKSEDIIKYIVLFLLISIVFYQRESIESANKYSAEEFTINSGKYFVLIIPLLFYVKKPLLKYALLGVLVFYIINSVKRGSILVATVLLLVMILNDLRGAKGKKRTFSILIIGISIVAIYYYISYMLNNSAYFLYRWEETSLGESSGRDRLYSTASDIFLHKSSFIQFLFGRGAYASVELMGQYAHNDWMEIALNNGLIGMIVYFIFYVSFAKYCYRFRKTRIFPIMFSYFIMILLFSFFSMGYEDMNIFYGMGLGYCLAESEEIAIK